MQKQNKLRNTNQTRQKGRKNWYTSWFVRVILVQGPCWSLCIAPIYRICKENPVWSWIRSEIDLLPRSSWSLPAPKKLGYLHYDTDLPTVSHFLLSRCYCLRVYLATNVSQRRDFTRKTQWKAKSEGHVIEDNHLAKGSLQMFHLRSDDHLDHQTCNTDVHTCHIWCHLEFCLMSRWCHMRLAQRRLLEGVYICCRLTLHLLVPSPMPSFSEAMFENHHLNAPVCTFDSSTWLIAMALTDLDPNFRARCGALGLPTAITDALLGRYHC